MNNFFEKGFENIKDDSEIEVTLKDGIIAINGKLIDNNSKELHIDEVLIDTTIRYDQIKSVTVF